MFPGKRNGNVSLTLNSAEEDKQRHLKLDFDGSSVRTTNISSLISSVLTYVLASRVCNGQLGCSDLGDLAIDLWREYVEPNEGDAAEVMVGFDLLYFDAACFSQRVALFEFTLIIESRFPPFVSR